MKKYRSIFQTIAAPASGIAFCVAAQFNPLWLVAAFVFYLLILWATAVMATDENESTNQKTTTI